MKRQRIYKLKLCEEVVRVSKTDFAFRLLSPSAVLRDTGYKNSNHQGV